MCLAQGHNTVTPVRLEPAAPRSRVKHSITEPLRSLWIDAVEVKSRDDFLNKKNTGRIRFKFSALLSIVVFWKSRAKIRVTVFDHL